MIGKNIGIVFIGILLFICGCVLYALSCIYSCPKGVKIGLLCSTVVLAVLFLVLSIRLDQKSMLVKIPVINIIVMVMISIFAGWILLMFLFGKFQYQLLYTNSRPRTEFVQRIKGDESFETIELDTLDGKKIKGYLHHGNTERKLPLLIYFGGRGEEASSIVPYSSMLDQDMALAFINYQGCGESTGKQSYKSIMSDAELIYDYFAGRDDIDHQKIVLMAHSLGTGVATQLATKKDVKGLILSCAYDKYVTGVIQDKIPLMPLKYVIREEFNSIEVAQKISSPTLFLLAQNDRTVLHGRTKRLMEQWGSSEKESYMIDDVNHETITMEPNTWVKVNEFLHRILK